jgi:hypothetical protein
MGGMRGAFLGHPIMMDGETLIDGRNRLKACEIATVEPRFEQLNGHDPVEYILAVNVARRHLTTGQQAMAIAIAIPSPGKDSGLHRNW